jgi:hypothetical protein
MGGKAQASTPIITGADYPETEPPQRHETAAKALARPKPSLA